LAFLNGDTENLLPEYLLFPPPELEQIEVK